jgi:GDPmannose 4,6-dehydratase
VDLLLGDASKARRELSWKPKVTFKQLAKRMTEHDWRLARRERMVRDHDEKEQPQFA